jgi:hypothetical protein
MATHAGIIRDGSSMDDWPKMEKRMQEIRKTLRTQFGITANPILFTKGTGYQALFKIVCAPSFDS